MGSIQCSSRPCTPSVGHRGTGVAELGGDRRGFLQAGPGVAAPYRGPRSPSVHLGEDGRVRVADFGLALPSEATLTEPGHTSALDDIIGVVYAARDTRLFLSAVHEGAASRPQPPSPFGVEPGSGSSGIAPFRGLRCAYVEGPNGIGRRFPPLR